MERTEPTFVPEWYKGSVTGSNNLNPQSGSSLQSDEQNVGFSSRNRLSVSICDYDASHWSFSDRTSSSFRRSASSNGYTEREKDSSSRTYSGFGRSFHDWNRDRDKDLEIHRERSLLLDNGFGDHPDALIIPGKPEKDSSRRSQSFLSGRRSDSWLKRAAVYDSSNGMQSVGSKISGTNTSSFEREFPSLVAEEKHVGSELPRVSSPGLSTAIHNLPLTASSILGGDGWTSALADVPPIVGENSLVVSPAIHYSPTLSPNVSITPVGLNMAETVAQAPARAYTVPQLPSESQKIEELHRQQILKLRPMTPSIPKNVGINLAEKSKAKAAKLAEYSSVKLGQHSSSPLVNHAFRSNIRSDVPKTSQAGNFQVLNREKSGASPTNKDNSRPRNGNRIAVTSGILPSTIPLLKGQVGPHILDVRAGALTGEKKQPSQTQNRNDFFNSLRKKTSSSSQGKINQDSRCNASAPGLEKLDGASEKTKDVASLSGISQCSVENMSCSESCEEVEEQLVPNKEEEAFLRSLGWEENDMEEALTPEEIESFLSEYEKKMPASKLKVAGCLTRLSSAFDAEVEDEETFC